MLSFFGWVLLAIAILSVLYAVYQYVMLLGMQIIINEMNLVQGWFTIATPSLVVLGISILGVANHDAAPWCLGVGVAFLCITLIYQASINGGMQLKRRQWEAMTKQRMSVQPRQYH